MNALQTIEQSNLINQWPSLKEMRPGDKVRVHVEIQEGGKTRIQDYEGVVIYYKKGGLNAAVCVRKISFGVGVERIFPVQSPVIKGIDIVTPGQVRQARIYYLRNLQGKAARIKARDLKAKPGDAPAKPRAKKAEGAAKPKAAAKPKPAAKKKAPAKKKA